MKRHGLNGIWITAILVISLIASNSWAAAASGSEIESLSTLQTDNAESWTADWWSAVQQDIYQSEYHVSWIDRSPLSKDGAYQAPNREQNLRTYFTPQGVLVTPRVVGEDGGWELGMALAGYGDGEAMQVVRAGEIMTDGNRVEYHRSAVGSQEVVIKEWYVNDERGVEQGFVISEQASAIRTTEGNQMLQITLSLAGDLEPLLVEDGQAIEFTTADGVSVLRYGELHVYDADGWELPAYLALETQQALHIVIDCQGARYPLTVDPLLTSASWTAEINRAGAEFGYAVSSAGDVNGDSYGDVIVGAPQFDGGTGGGRVYVYFGSAEGLSASVSWRADSDVAGAELGYAVSTAGDVNGDKCSDVIVGARLYNGGQVGEGAAFVWFGSDSGLGDNGTPANADWLVQSNQADAELGYAVSTAGDVNGDGFGDVIVGARLYNGGAASEGAVFVWLGSDAGLGADGTPANADWSAESDQAGAELGSAVSTAGDVNGDGFGDVIVGARLYNGGAASEGVVFVWLGSDSGLGADGTPVNADWSAESNQAGAELGYAVSTAGDVDGDGFSDVIVGARLYNGGAAGEGMAFAWLGSDSGLGTNGTPANADWSVKSNQAGAELGGAVATAGDVNGDGYADVIVGAKMYDSALGDEGWAAVYQGSGAGLQDTAIWSVIGEKAGAAFGGAVALAGDVSGDGYSDVIVGAAQYSNGETGEGKAYVYYGQASGLGVSPDDVLIGNQSSSYFGWSVAGAGDVNGDSYSDVVVGAPQYDNGQTDEGRAFVFHGSASGLSATPDWTVEINQAFAQFGYAVSTAGDVDGNGCSDVLVGAPQYDGGQTNEGAVFLYYGSTDGLETTARWSAEGDKPAALFGSAVATAGDVNGDSRSDLIIGAYHYDNGQADEGRAYVYYSRVSGPGATPWTAESNQANAEFGWSVASAGDVNGDGYADVIVGARYYDGGETAEGRVYVYHGSSTGVSITANWTMQSNQEGALMGISVAGAGDVNGDSYSDVIVGASGYDEGETNEGKAFVYLGSATGVKSAVNWTGQPNVEEASFGWSVSTAGDVNGDGYTDIIVGAYRYGNVESNEGKLFLYYGSSFGVKAALAWSVEGQQDWASLGYSVASAGDVNGDGYADVVAGAYIYDVSISDDGFVMVFWGNAGGGRGSAARQMWRVSVAGLPWGPSGFKSAFQARLPGYNPLGRSKVRLQVQACLAGVKFGSTSCKTAYSSWEDSTASAMGVNLEALMSGLTSNKLYHWRARVIYSSITLNSQHGPWRRLFAQSQEADVRIRAMYQILVPLVLIPAP